MAATRRVALSALGALALALVARGSPPAETAGEGSTGQLVIRDDLTVRKWVYFPKEKLTRTQEGSGQLSGAELTVTFTGSGDPRDLEGHWTLAGESSEQGRYRGTVVVTKADDKWRLTFEPISIEQNAPLPHVEADAALEGMVLTVEREGASVAYTLRGDGKALVAKLGSETLRRSTLPANGAEKAVYTFEGGKLSGKLASGATETGARIVQKGATDAQLLALEVQPDPVPATLRTVRAAVALRTPKGPVGERFKPHADIPIRGRDGDFYLVGPLRDAKGYWTGYVRATDVASTGSYATVQAPIFLPGKQPTPNNVVQGNLNTCYFDSALMAIAEFQPGTITSMIRDLKDGTVAVRFHERDASGHWAEQWVRIQKTIPVDAQGHGLYTRPDGTGQLWPALATKGFAAWSGKGKGFYRALDMGDAKDAFELVTGQDAKTTFWGPELPGVYATAQLKKDVPEMSRADTAAITAYGRSAAWKSVTSGLVRHQGWREDLAYALSLLPAIPDLSTEGKSQLEKYLGQRVDGPPGTGGYGPKALEIFTQIQECVKKKRPTCASTIAWESPPRPNADGYETVEGLASPHFYTVVGASEDEHKVRWVKLYNPTHALVRTYERKGDTLVTGGRSNAEQRDEAFDVELSDVHRYFSWLEWVE